MMGTTNRRDYLSILFPDGIPKLWCPPLTHFTAQGALDEQRIRAHLGFLAPSVGGVLVPGTTGEGWELSDSEISELLRIVTGTAAELGFRILVGILKPTVDEMIETAERIAAELGIPLHDEAGTIESLAERRIAGFTFCAPRGEPSQQAIHSALDRVLDLGLPSALYQLPQVTGNEFDANTLHELSLGHDNLYLVKDSSGMDRVRLSGLDFGGLYFARGAEGDYARWYGEAADSYDGFLLSTANCFPRQLSVVTDRQTSPERRRKVSDEITLLINEAFNAVQMVGQGNPFTNANKAIDHFNAYGSEAKSVSGPRLHGGTIISDETLAQVEKILQRHGLLPSDGYLETR